MKLSDIVSVESKFGFATITRDNGQEKIVLSGDISEDDPKKPRLSNEIKNKLLPELEKTFGVEAELSGL